MKQKRIAAIHDISGVGKCSLTVALPICSAAGLETAVLPTAVLSTHTGGFKGYTFCDLSNEILPIARHWKSEGLTFDAFYTGYLGSAEQADLVIAATDLLKSDNTLLICDPAMADNGRLYAGFPEDFPTAMLRLCKKADIILPNITEACLLTGTEYHAGPYTEDYITDLLDRLYSLTGTKIVLTGVWFDDSLLGAATFDGQKTEYLMGQKINAFFHGTGDVFAASFTSAFLNDRTLPEAVRFAVEFTRGCILKTLEDPDHRKYGVCFEQQLPELIRFLESRP